MATVAEVFALAVQYHQAGNLQKAQQLYHQILGADPNHADTHHALGMLALQAGRPDLAVPSIRRALAFNPQSSAYFGTLGMALHGLGQRGEAVTAFREAVRLNPTDGAARNNLGSILFQEGKPEEAAAEYRQALQLVPGNVDVMCNLGAALGTAGRSVEAIEQYQRVLSIRPDLPEANHNLGHLLMTLGRTKEAAVHLHRAAEANPKYSDSLIGLGNAFFLQNEFGDAVAAFRLAVRCRPDFAEAYNNLACALRAQHDLNEAERHAREALRLRPDFAEGYTTLGNIMLELQKSDEAVSCFKEAMRLKPTLLEAHKGLGNALQELGQIAEAHKCYRQALTLAPNDAEAHANEGNAFAREDNLEEALRWYKRALELQPSLADTHYSLGWVYLRQGQPALAEAEFRKLMAAQPDLPKAQPSLLFSLNYDPEADLDLVFAEHRKWGERQEKSVTIKPHTNDRSPDRRLRVGYLSPDLRDHALNRYFEPVLTNHDPQQVEAYCYAEVALPDAVSSRLQKLAHGWCWTSRMNHAQLAERIRADRIDILVDLAAHTGKSRLRVMAQKPAPVQATWLGYMNTTGLKTVDYRITDAILDPPGQRVRDTEELLRLPEGACCFAAPPQTPDVTPLPALRTGHVTFGSLNNLIKLNSKVFELWSRILKAAPTTRLLIFQDSLTDTTKNRIRRQFAEFGIGDERLELRRAPIVAGYLKIYDDIDIGLDSFPCTGGVTTCESLWMGVPLITLCGARPAGRQSASLLARVGLTDWTASTPEQYIDLAVAATKDLDRLTQLRSTLRDRVAATLGDARRFTRQLEDAYRAIWQRWCQDGR